MIQNEINSDAGNRHINPERPGPLDDGLVFTPILFERKDKGRNNQRDNDHSQKNMREK